MNSHYRQFRMCEAYSTVVRNVKSGEIDIQRHFRLVKCIILAYYIELMNLLHVLKILHGFNFPKYDHRVSCQNGKSRKNDI